MQNILLLLGLLFAVAPQILAGDKAAYPTPFLGGDNVSVRQKVCERYLRYNSGETELKNSLSGLELRPILTISRFFHYTEEEGIDETDPGLVVRILDEMAKPERGNFTWRNSFAVSSGPEPNTTWTQMLVLYTEMFDISIDYWDKNALRLGAGVSFLDQWFDGNIILIEKVEPLEKDTSVNFTNFLKPFTWNVWCVTLATILASAFIYQWLEYLNNERDDRTLWKWFEDNLYLSSINFTQQYAYEPTSGAGRILGFSLAVWSMVMGATYTANLASLFVEELGQPHKVSDIDEAIRLQYKICTWRGTNADLYIEKRYPRAIRVPMDTEIEAYQALQDGTCDITIGGMSTWLGYQMDREYNPKCDLEWVGKTVEEVSTSFAVKADPAQLCTNLIRDVLNYHLLEMHTDGTMERLWDDYYNNNENAIDCTTYEPGDEEKDEQDLNEVTDFRRLLSSSDKDRLSTRQLKGGGGGANPAAAASGGSDDEENSSLSMSAMAGTFLLHAALSLVAIITGIISCHRKKKASSKRKRGEESDTDGEDTNYQVAGMSMASGTCSRDKRVGSLMNKTGPVEEQLQALFDAQREMQQNQDHLTQQMDLVVSLLTKMQQERSGEDSTVLTEPSTLGKFSSYFSSS